MKILIIIPAYNEEKSILKVVENIQRHFPKADYIVINDCSKDSTEKVLVENGLNHLNLKCNLGIGGGVQSGYKYAVLNGYDIAIQIDGDGQHDPQYLGRLIEPIIKGEADMVIGSRFIECEGFQTSFMRRFGIRLLQTLIKICCGVNITDATSGFRATSKDLIKMFAEEYAQDYPEPEAIIFGVLNGYRVKEVPVIMHERKEGKSSINVSKSIYYMIKVSLAIVLCRLHIKRNVKER